MNQEIKHVLENWGILSNQVTQIYTSAWDVDDIYVLKVYQNRDQLLKNANIAEALRKYDIPAAEVVYTAAGEKYVEEKGNFYLLTKKLKGINQINIRDQRLEEQMGCVIARLHKAFLKLENEFEFGDNRLLAEMEGWIQENLATDGWQLISQTEYGETIEKLRKVNDRLPRQLIHRDVHFNNFLFLDGNFSGYIDFDLSQKNIRIFDLGYFLAGLWIEDATPSLSKEEWLQIVTVVIKGYESINQLTYQEKEALPCVMECIEILFAAYFAGRNERQYAESARDIFRLICSCEEKLRKVLAL